MSHTAKMVVWTETERQLGRMEGVYIPETRMLAPADDPSSPCRWHKSGRDRNQQASKMTWKAVGINVDIIEICCSVWPEKYMNASKAIFSQSGSEKCKSCLHGFAFWILLLPTNNSKQNPDSWLKSKQYYNLDEEFKNQDDGFMQHQHHLYHPTLITQWKTATS